MEEYQPLKYIEKIVLEILDRRRPWSLRWRGQRTEKLHFGEFNPNEAAYAFLRQYDGHVFFKAQKFTLWCKNQELRLCVRDLAYGRSDRTASTMVEFTYRKTLFSEIKWPIVAVNRTSRVRWANDYSKVSAIEVPENYLSTPHSSINADESINGNSRIVPCVVCHSLTDDDQSSARNSGSENAINSLCRACRSTNDGRNLLTDNQDVTVTSPVDNEDHFRTSIYIHVNPICYP